jgi:class 3 adenylate cyclase
VDVSAWLKDLGLGQYQASFRDNAIEGDVLPTLTAEDLKDLGVTIVGHRRKLLDAIGALGAASKPMPPPAAAEPPATFPAPAASTRSQSRSGADAERRPITVMFCDLVGSTSLAAKLDAEDWRNLVNAYLDEATTAVTGLGGHVLKRLGDGLMALFGYPHAQENDAERAVRAALAIQRGLADINARNSPIGGPELSARVGLESGPVVVEMSGEVFGDAPNIAARVQAAADPGSVLITTNVQRQVAGLFVVEERGAHDLKGVSAPVALYRVVRASGGRRFGARTLTPLGRGARPFAPALGASGQKRGPVYPCCRRARHRQVAACGGVSLDARRDRLHLGRILFIATVAEYAVAPDRRMGTAAFRRRRHPRGPTPRRPREHAAADRSRR